MISLIPCFSSAESCHYIFKNDEVIPHRQTRARKWSEDKVIIRIKALAEAQLDISASAMMKAGIEYNQILEAVLWPNVTASKLYHAKPTPNWTWRQALTLAGFNSRNYQRSWRKWTVTEVTSFIKELERQNLPYTRQAVLTGDHRYQTVLDKIVEPGLSLRSLIIAQPESDWNWQRALERATVDLNGVAFTGEWQKKDIITAIKSLIAANLPVNYRSLKKGGIAYTRALQNTFGAKVNLRTLLQTNPEPSWTWNDSLLAAGVNTRLFIYSGILQREDILTAIQAFQQQGLDLSYGFMRDNKELYNPITERLFTKRVAVRKLMEAAQGYGWSWAEAVEAAGFRYNDYSRHAQLSEEDIITAILAFREANLPLNWTALNFGGRKYQTIINRLFGIKVTPQQIAHAKPKPHWNWSMALIQAGLDPNEIRLKGSVDFNLLPTHLKEELTRRYEALFGARQRVFIEGKDPEISVSDMISSEDTIIQNEVIELISEELSSLSQDEKSLFDQLLEYFQQVGNFNHEDFLKFVNDDNVTLDDINNLIKKIQSNEQIRSLLTQ